MGHCHATRHEPGHTTSASLARKGQDSDHAVLFKDHHNSRGTTTYVASYAPEPKVKLMKYARLCKSHKTIDQTFLACVNWCS